MRLGDRETKRRNDVVGIANFELVLTNKVASGLRISDFKFFFSPKGYKILIPHLPAGKPPGIPLQSSKGLFHRWHSHAFGKLLWSFGELLLYCPCEIAATPLLQARISQGEQSDDYCVLEPDQKSSSFPSKSSKCPWFMFVW